MKRISSTTSSNAGMQLREGRSRRLLRDHDRFAPYASEIIARIASNEPLLDIVADFAMRGINIPYRFVERYRYDARLGDHGRRSRQCRAPLSHACRKRIQRGGRSS